MNEPDEVTTIFLGFHINVFITLQFGNLSRAHVTLFMAPGPEAVRVVGQQLRKCEDALRRIDFNSY